MYSFTQCLWKASHTNSLQMQLREDLSLLDVETDLDALFYTDYSKLSFSHC